jgi:hypothetical protein
VFREGVAKETEFSLVSPSLKQAPPIDNPFWKKIEVNLDFTIIGAPKCATTWICDSLNEHPDVYIPGEQNFFTQHQNKGMEYYNSLYSNIDSNKLLGDYSNTYMLDQNLPHVFSELFPDIKIIMICRHPIKRAFSHYIMDFPHYKKSVTQYSFYQCLVKPKNYSLFDFGLYIKHLNRYLARLDQNNFMVVTVDQIKANPGRVIETILQFLGVSDHHLNRSIRPSNTWEGERIKRIDQNSITRNLKSFSRMVLPPSIRSSLDYRYRGLLNLLAKTQTRKKPVLPTDVGRALIDEYRPYNELLADFLDLDLSAWNRLDETQS